MRGATLVDENNLLIWLDRLVIIVNLVSLNITQVLKSHLQNVAVVTVLDNGKIVSTSKKDDEIVIWAKEV